MTSEAKNIESVWTVANGWRIHSRAALRDAPANAPDVVLIHGLVVSSTYMRPLIEALAPDYRVLAPDLPGFGNSDKPDHTLSIPELADALLEWLDSVGLERPLMIGNSFGSQVLVEFATRYPGRVRRAVLVGPTVDPQARTLPSQAARWVLNSLTEPLSLGPILIRDYAKAGFLRTIKTLRIYVSDAVEQKYPKVAIPTLVVRGALDAIVTERWAREVTTLLPDGKFSVIPGIGHTANYSAPLEIARMARIFDQHPNYVHATDGR